MQVRQILNKVRSNWTIGALLFSTAIIAYSHTLTRLYTFDAVSYATQIRQSVEKDAPGLLFHPHHVLFNAIGFLCWRLLRLFGLQVDPLASLQYVNAFWGAVGVVLVYIVVTNGGIRLARRTTGTLAGGSALGAAAALAFGSGFGYWTCATDGRVNMPGLVLVTLTVGLLWGMLDAPSKLQCVAAGVATTVAVGFHQSHGLLLIAGAGAMLLSPKPIRQRMKNLALYLAVALGGITAMYLIIGIGVKGFRSIAEFRSWSLAYAEDGRWWSFDVRGNLWLDAKALIHSFVSSSQPIGEANGATSVEVFRRALACAAAGTAILAFWHATYLLLRLVRTKLSELPPRRTKFAVLALLAVPYAAFFTVWNPGYFVFWMPVALTLILWLALAGSKKKSFVMPLAAIMATWAIVSVSINLPYTILPRSEAQNNSLLTMCAALSRNTDPGDVIIITGTSSLANVETYIPYFTALELRSLNIEMKEHGPQAAIKALRNDIHGAISKGHRVILFDEFESLAAWQLIHERYNISAAAEDQILAGYDVKPLFAAGQTQVYGLLPKNLDLVARR